jgi:hypothetical protein
MKRSVLFAVITSISLTTIAFAATYDVDITAKAPNICVLPGPTESGSGLQSVSATNAEFKASISGTGFVEDTSGTLTFVGAYCNGSANIKLESMRLGAGLQPPTGFALPSGFASHVDYSATVIWGSGNSLNLDSSVESSTATFSTVVGDLSLEIAVNATDLPIASTEYSDTLKLTVTAN